MQAQAVGEQAQAVEDRILRTWTPLLLRTILSAAVAVLIVGLIYTAIKEPAFYVNRYHEVRAGTAKHSPENVIQLVERSSQGDAHSILTLGLFILTLVPLGRVAFTLLLFIHERDVIYIVATAYVLTGLILGVFLGRIG
ncbi:MAG TPA: DUF1634 domain-containing protein [Candidatus Binataceae bacterium]|nr:DUF1634 domain-containing protein [Candidatus Binataceae bacterium]